MTKENLSRRNFLVKAGALTAGMAVAGGLFGSIVGSAEAAQWNLPYAKKLDLDLVRKRGFENYFKGACMYGAASALIISIREANPGTDWDKVPEDMFRYGGGGIASWGTLCGALNGSLYVMALAAGNSNMGLVGNELLHFYTKFPFPSTKLDNVIEGPVGKDASGNTIYGSFKNQVTTVSNSPLCHNSVSRWCQASGFTVSSYEKKHRCAKLTGETAAKAAELLNKLLIEKITPSQKFVASTNFCMACHAPGNTNMADDFIDYPEGNEFNPNNEQGKMNCGDCHDSNHEQHLSFVENIKNSCGICHE